MKENKDKDQVKPKRNQSDGSDVAKGEQHVDDKEEPVKRITRKSNEKEEGFYKFNSMMLRNMSSQGTAILPMKARKRSQKHAKSKRPQK